MAVDPRLHSPAEMKDVDAIRRMEEESNKSNKQYERYVGDMPMRERTFREELDNQIDELRRKLNGLLALREALPLSMDMAADRAMRHMIIWSSQH